MTHNTHTWVYVCVCVRTCMRACVSGCGCGCVGLSSRLPKSSVGLRVLHVGLLLQSRVLSKTIFCAAVLHVFPIVKLVSLLSVPLLLGGGFIVYVVFGRKVCGVIINGFALA